MGKECTCQGAGVARWVIFSSSTWAVSANCDLLALFATYTARSMLVVQTDLGVQYTVGNFTATRISFFSWRGWVRARRTGGSRQPMCGSKGSSRIGAVELRSSMLFVHHSSAVAVVTTRIGHRPPAERQNRVEVMSLPMYWYLVI